MTCIYIDAVPEFRRAAHTAALFGLNFSLRLEPFVFSVAGQLSPDYQGGYLCCDNTPPGSEATLLGGS